MIFIVNGFKCVAKLQVPEPPENPVSPLRIEAKLFGFVRQYSFEKCMSKKLNRCFIAGAKDQNN